MKNVKKFQPVSIRAVEGRGGCNDEGAKRQRANYVLDVICPTCKKEIAHDLRDNYLSYPIDGEDYAVSIMCTSGSPDYDECTEFRVWVRFKIVIEQSE